MKFNFRINDLEVRSCGDRLLQDDTHYRAEIVKWNKDHCYTLAYWNKDSESYNLLFVGNRPFEVDSKTFMKLALHGQEILNDYFTE